MFCPNGFKIAKTLTAITEGNNVDTFSRPLILHEVLIEVAIMINKAKYFIMQRKNKKAFAFYLRESYSPIIIHHEIHQLLYIRIQFDEKDPRIIYRLTPVIQDTYINR